MLSVVYGRRYKWIKKKLFQRLRQNLDRTRPDHGPDHGSDHGPDHRKKILKNEKIQI